MIQTELSELENIIVSAKFPKGLISEIHAVLLHSDSSAYDALKRVWEHDLGVTFSSTDWTKIRDGIFPKCTSISIHEQNSFSIGSILHLFTSRKCLQTLQTYVLSVKNIKVHLFICFGLVATSSHFGMEFIQ